MNDNKYLIKKLRSPDNKIVLQAIEGLRVRGLLETGILDQTALRYAHMERADFYKASLRHTDLSMADLRWANLSLADLEGAQLNSANLFQADMSMANLKGANLIRANLQGVHNLKDEQLARANQLFGATMPDGSRYDGRFNLKGDLLTAVTRGVDLKSQDAMKEFYCSLPLDMLPEPENMDASISEISNSQLVRMLRGENAKLVVKVLDELRKRNLLKEGLLKWTCLRYVHFKNADLSHADLQNANFGMADLREADLSFANLKGARFTKANLSGANLEGAELKGALLAHGNLFQAKGLTDEQFCEVNRLRRAMMPDGTRYDGRYNLPGDLWDANFFHVDVSDPKALAAFYGISTSEFTIGQKWSQESLPVTWRDIAVEAVSADVESVIQNISEQSK
ncbi:MAG: pentapeptide repeat-containing protein [Anaerolineales bacterium]|jgi:uncharacterized protein YjbI with pentapeptide repeats